MIEYPDYVINFFNYAYNQINGKLDGNKTRNAPENVINWLKEHNLTFSKLRYLLINKLNYLPYCKICGKPLKKYEFRKTYYCSIACSRKDIENDKKRKQTNLERYGTENPSQNKNVIEKREQTCLERYGVKNPFQSEKIKEKMKQTWIENYRVDNPNKSQVIKEKYKQICEEKYGKGIINSFQSEEVKEKIKQTNLEKYGTENPNQCQEIKEKTKQTNLEKYGVEWGLQSDIVKGKIKNTFIEKYGVTNPRKTKFIQDITTKTRRQNYYDRFLSLLDEKNISLEMTKNEYANSDILKFKCLICNNSFETNKTNPQNIYCPHCFKQHYSIKEKEVLDWIKIIYSGEIIENDRVILKGKELDIYIPEKKLAIEFNGNYWHNVEKVGKYYHQEKTLACKEQGIRLIHIFEYEWINKQDICKSLIKSALGTYDKSIYARNCIIKDISSDDYRNFLNENHLQGSVNSSIRYGLYYQDELAAVIGFGKSRFKSGEMELHRFCCKLNYHIPGAFSKLIKHSRLNDFITYVDLAHFSGEGYKELGFKEISVTEPNYKWVKGYSALNRFATQKHKLKEFLKENYDENLTETENMRIMDMLKYMIAEILNYI